MRNGAFIFLKVAYIHFVGSLTIAHIGLWRLNPMPKTSSNEDALSWIEDHDEAICAAIVNRLNARLFPPSPALLRKAVGPYLQKTLQTDHIEVEVERLPHDTSSYPRRTNRPWPYQDYDTMQDFLREPDGNTTATYQSGSGFMAATLDDDFWGEVLSLITEEVRQILQDDSAGILAAAGADAGVQQTDPVALHDFLCDLLNDAISDQGIETDLMVMIYQMSFRDVARAINPDVYQRIIAGDDAFSLLSKASASSRATSRGG